MNGYNFTDRVRKVLQMAREEAARLHHEYVGTEHILLGLIREGEGVAAAVLQNLNVDLEEIQQKIEETVKKGKAAAATGPDLPYTSRAKKVLELAMTEARELNHSYVGTEHLLLGLLREEKGIAAQVLTDAGVNLEQSRAETLRLLGSDMPQTQQPGSSPTPAAAPKSEKKSKTPALDHFCRDLTQLAAEGQLDPTIGRAKEIERVMEILARRKKNNPVLIGEPGVGKTAIVEGLALMIANGTVPRCPQGPPGALARHGGGDRGHQVPRPVRGAAQGGHERDRPEQADHPVHRRAAHARRGGRGRGRHRRLQHAQARAGAGRAAVRRRLDPERVPQVHREGRRARAAVPDGHGRSADASTRPSRSSRACARSTRTTTGWSSPTRPWRRRPSCPSATSPTGSCPDKAIDVIDEAGARARLASQVPPAEVANLKADLEKVNLEKEDAVRDQNFERAAALRDKERDLQNQIRLKQEEWEKERQTRRPVISEEDIAFIVSRWTGIPVTRLQEQETARLLRMEDELHLSVVGQDEAIKAISRAIRRSRAGLKDPKHPIGSFIFCGPTGVGKTELARALAKFLFADPSALIRVDMSEYMEKFSVSRLIGAPPGYVGYEDSGTLTKAIRRKPYSVVLLDEIEKAHPDVFNILLQVLDEGHLTDNYGRMIDFKNTVVIMTSNVGARDIMQGKTLGFHGQDFKTSFDKMQEKIRDEIQKVFNPEFLNRIDDTIVFHPLDKEHIAQIVGILVREVQKRVGDEIIRLTPAATDFLVEHGYDQNYGARPLKRAIQKYIEDPLSEKILLGEFTRTDEIEVDVAPDGERLAFRALSGSKA